MKPPPCVRPTRPIPDPPESDPQGTIANLREPLTKAEAEIERNGKRTILSPGDGRLHLIANVLRKRAAAHRDAVARSERLQVTIAGRCPVCEGMNQLGTMCDGCSDLAAEACEAAAKLSRTEDVAVRYGTVEGRLWSMIRGGLSYCQDDIKGHAAATQYEVASAHEDAIARTIASYMVGDIRRKIQAAEAALAAKGGG